MKVKIGRIIYVIVMTVIIMSCGKPQGKHPAQEKFEKSMDALRRGENVMKYKYGEEKVFSEGYKKMTYKVLKVDKEEKKTTIHFEMRIPKLPELDSETKNAISEKRKKANIENFYKVDREVQEIIINFYMKELSSPSLEYVSGKSSIIYEKNENEWYVSKDNNRTGFWEDFRLGTHYGLNIHF